MKNYLFDSIERNLCLKTDCDTLDILKFCSNCHKIPLPSYKSNKDINLALCQTCYYLLDNKEENLMNPSNSDLKLLSRLIFSCENFNEGCVEEFTINSLDIMHLHKQNCKTRNNKSQQSENFPNVFQINNLHKRQLKTNKSNDYIVDPNLKIYDYIRQTNKELKSEIDMMIQNALLKQEKLFEDKISKLELKINSLSEENALLKQQSSQNIQKITTHLSYNKTEPNDSNCKKPRPIESNNDIELHIINNNCSSKLYKNKTTLKGHESRVLKLIELSDGRIASCSNDKNIRIWDLKSNKCIFTVKLHDNYVSCLIQLNCGKIASGSADLTIKIFDLKKNQLVQVFEGHTGTIQGLIQIKDSKIASCSDDCKIRIWDIKLNKCSLIINAHDDIITCMIQLSDKNIASGSWDKTIKVWDWKTGECVHTLRGHKDHIRSLIQLNDNKIASCSEDKMIRLWDQKTYQCIFIFDWKKYFIYSMILLKDGQIASCSDDKTIKIWDVNTKKCSQTLKGHDSYVLCIIQLKDGKLASCSDDKTIKIWE